MSVLTCQNGTACHLSASGFRLATTHNSRLNNFKCECGAKVSAHDVELIGKVNLYSENNGRRYLFAVTNACGLKLPTTAMGYISSTEFG
jgi:hypothetical protein